jgi:hypothetical protein
MLTKEQRSIKKTVILAKQTKGLADGTLYKKVGFERFSYRNDGDSSRIFRISMGSTS